MKETKLKSAVPVYLAGLSWAVYAVIFLMYRISDLLVIFAVSVAVYFIFSKLTPEKTVLLPDTLTFDKTGDIEKDAFLAQCAAYTSHINRLLLSVQDEAMRSHIETLTASGKKIFDFIAANPADIRQSRNFIEYYYPTAIKLTESYMEFTSHAANAASVSETAQRIDGVILSIAAAFDKHFETLYESKVIDVKTDIEVLNGMLRASALDGSDAIKGAPR